MPPAKHPKYLQALIDQSPLIRRHEALALAEDHGKKPAEIAKLMGVTRQCVEAWIAKAREERENQPT